MYKHVILILYIIHYILNSILMVYEIQGNISLQDYITFVFHYRAYCVALLCVASRFSKVISTHCRGNFKSKSNSFS